MAASAELTARGADDVSDRLVRVEQLRERARGLAAVIVERRRALERDRGQLLDAGVVASLEGDAARYAEELADRSTPTSTRLQPGDRRPGSRRGSASAPSAKACSSCSTRPAAASASSAVAEVRGELRSRRAAAERAEAELIARPSPHRPSSAERIAELDGRLDELRHECNACELVETPARRRDRAGPNGTVQHAEAELEACTARAPAGRRAGVGARRPGSTRCSWRSTPPAPAPAPSASPDVDGVLGTLLDLVRIDAGWEPPSRPRSVRR